MLRTKALGFLVAMLLILLYSPDVCAQQRADHDSLVGVKHGRINYSVVLVGEFYEHINIKEFFGGKKEATETLGEEIELSSLTLTELVMQHAASLVILCQSFEINWSESASEYIVVGDNVTLTSLGHSKPHTNVMEPEKIRLSLYPSWQTVIVLEYLLASQGEESHITVYGRALDSEMDGGVYRYKVLVPTTEFESWLQEDKVQ